MNPIDQAIRGGLLENDLYLRNAPYTADLRQIYRRRDIYVSAYSTVCRILYLTDNNPNLYRKNLSVYFRTVLLQEQQKKMTE